ncbi:MAG: hypothetical protein ACF8Q5_01175 [Phycisphaerales bacterium JB040]
MSDATRRLVDETVERVLAVREDLASEPDEVRHSFMLEEIERSAGGVEEGERGAFLEAVHARLPSIMNPEADDAGVGDVLGEGPAVVGDGAEGAGAGEAMPERAAEPASGAGSGSGPGSGSGVGSGTASGAASGVGGVPVEGALAKALGLEPGTELDGAAAVALLGVLVEMTRSLDQVMWSTWKVLAPRSGIRGAGDLLRSAGGYARGECGLDEVRTHSERLRQLSAALVSAISQTGRQFSARHAERFSPEQIEAWSAREKKSVGSSAAECWKKYKEMFGTADQATIEREIQQQIAEYGERLMTGLDRSGSKG